MNKIKKIEDFLNLMNECAKNNIIVDSNLVYANLTNMGAKRERINGFFPYWIQRFENSKNMKVFVNESWKYFCQFKSKKQNMEIDKIIKIYIPLDKEHIYRGANEIFEFLSDNNIVHQSKIGSETRFDDIVVRVNDIYSAETLRNFINNNKYIQEGLMEKNPFCIGDDKLAVTWDGTISYNQVVAEYISDYINSNNKDVSYQSFYEYIIKKYNEVYINGKNINDFMQSRKYVNSVEDLANHQIATEVLINTLRTKSNLESFYRSYIHFTDKDQKKENISRLNNLLEKDRIHKNSVEDYSKEQKEAFDYAFIVIAQKASPKNAMDVFKAFSNEGEHYGNYRVFTSTGNVRNIIRENNITPEVMKKMVLDEQIEALDRAIIKTAEKYDYIQATRALFLLSESKNYDSFTNKDNVRDNLKIMINPDELDEVIHEKLKREGYEMDKSKEEYWIYTELMQNMEKQNTK